MSDDSKVSDLLLEWEERREQGRSVPVEDLCRDYPDLLPEVRRRAEALQAMNPLLGPPPEPDGRAGSQTIEVPDPGLGTPGKTRGAGGNEQDAPLPTVPGYEILRELGHGGMGVVYLARQASLGRLVALKMLLAGPLADAERRRRFRAEAEAVARLKHPNIVQVYEVGEAEGRAYCALEYVEGPTLARALNGTPCPPLDAAELLAKLADAVHEAHARGILHRDLKPGNVLLAPNPKPETRNPKQTPKTQEENPKPGGGLVSDLGPLGLGFVSDFGFRISDFSPKVADFGLAKDLAGGPGLTASGEVLGTPCYMAPEQAMGRGKELGPATDVYSLGVILYEALTGRPPLLGATVLETLHQVMTLEPLPPRRLQPGVPRDLETICLKCLHKDPARRYPSAAALADDLRRFLRGEPVHARPAPRWERALKWARRHPAAAGLVAVSLLAGLALGVGAYVYNEQLRKELDEANVQRTRAEENFHLARRVVDDLTTRLQHGEHLRVEDLRKELSRLALTYYQDFVTRHGDDPALRAAVGRGYLHLAEITAELGSREEQALGLYRKALDIFEELYRADPDNLSHRRDLARAHYALGRTFRDISRLTDAEKELREAYVLQKALREKQPGNVEDLRDLARTCMASGQVSFNLGRGASRTKGFFQEGLALLDQVDKQSPPGPEDLWTRGQLWEGLGIEYLSHNQLDRAWKVFTQAAALQEKLVADHPGVSAFQGDLGHLNNRLGQVAFLQGKKDFREYRHKAVALLERLVQDHPETTKFAVELGTAYWGLARAAATPADRITWFSRAISVLEPALAREPRLLQAAWILSFSYEDRAWARNQLGHYAEALPDWTRAIKVQEKLLADNPRLHTARQSLGLSLLGRARARNRLGRYAEALPDWTRAIEVLEKFLADNPGFQGGGGSLGEAFLGRATAWKNLGSYEKALADLRRAEPLDPARRASNRVNQAVTLARLGRLKEAEELADRTRSAPLTPAQLVGLARVYALSARASGAGRGQQAERWAARAVDLLKQARQAGLFPGPAGLDRLRQDPDFAALRGRPDFQELVGTKEKKE